MSQELEFPVSQINSVIFSPTQRTWIVSLNEMLGEGIEATSIDLVCNLIAANIDTFYVSCEEVIGGELPHYVRPMKRDE